MVLLSIALRMIESGGQASPGLVFSKGIGMSKRLYLEWGPWVMTIGLSGML